jgi:hypothetical protein
MKPLSSARSAERSNRSSRRRPTRNRHNRPKKKNQRVVVGQKVLLVGLRVLPVDQAGHLEDAEDDGPRKAWIEPGKAWIGPRKAQNQRRREHSKRKREHRKDKGVVGDAVIHELPRMIILGN